jgi:hypothetical protein
MPGSLSGSTRNEHKKCLPLLHCVHIKPNYFMTLQAWKGNNTTQLIGTGSVREPQRRMDGQSNLKLVKEVWSFLKEKTSL